MAKMRRFQPFTWSVTISQLNAEAKSHRERVDAAEGDRHGEKPR
jgi:hypothetical protein